MSYHVIIQPNAEAELDAAYQWIRERAHEAAGLTLEG